MVIALTETMFVMEWMIVQTKKMKLMRPVWKMQIVSQFFMLVIVPNNHHQGIFQTIVSLIKSISLIVTDGVRVAAMRREKQTRFINKGQTKEEKKMHSMENDTPEPKAFNGIETYEEGEELYDSLTVSNLKSNYYLWIIIQCQCLNAYLGMSKKL